MYLTIFLTVLSGVLTFVIGQFILKMVIEPVHEMKKTIGQISHSLIEHANIIHNPGVPSPETMDATSKHLRLLSSKLHCHLQLVPLYKITSFIFCLPSQQKVLSASSSLIGLSNSLVRTTDRIHEQNARKVENVCDSLGIYLADGDRWPQ